jgi:hypothetical protein
MEISKHSTTKRRKNAMRKNYIRIVTEDDEAIRIDENFTFEDILEVMKKEYFWVVYEDARSVVICNSTGTSVTMKKPGDTLDKDDLEERFRAVEVIYYKLKKLKNFLDEATESAVAYEKLFEN